MDIKDYISSGIIENYVLGATSSEENAELERLADMYPEIRQEIEASKFALTEYIFQFQLDPPADLKGRIMRKLSDLDMPISSQNSPERSDLKVYKSQNRDLWRTFGIAASILLLVSGLANWFQFQNTQALHQELSVLEAENNRIQNQLQVAQADYRSSLNDLQLLNNPEFDRVELYGSDDFPNSRVSILWNPHSSSVYLQVLNLPKPPPGKQYQLWSVYEGDVKDAGVFEMSSNGFALHRMKETDKAEQFIITLEKMGGVPKAEGKAYALGKV